jgi:hypothetical protein
MAAVKVRQKPEKALKSAYGRTFDDDSQRVAYLFGLPNHDRRTL